MVQQAQKNAVKIVMVSKDIFVKNANYIFKSIRLLINRFSKKYGINMFGKGKHFLLYPKNIIAILNVFKNKYFK